MSEWSVCLERSVCQSGQCVRSIGVSEWSVCQSGRCVRAVGVSERSVCQSGRSVRAIGVSQRSVCQSDRCRTDAERNSYCAGHERVSDTTVVSACMLTIHRLQAFSAKLVCQ